MMEISTSKLSDNQEQDMIIKLETWLVQLRNLKCGQYNWETKFSILKILTNFPLMALMWDSLGVTVVFSKFSLMNIYCF